MNYRMVSYIIGQIVRVEGILMIPSLVVSVIYSESAFAAFLIPIVLSVAAGTLLILLIGYAAAVFTGHWETALPPQMLRMFLN